MPGHLCLNGHGGLGMRGVMHKILHVILAKF